MAVDANLGDNYFIRNNGGDSHGVLPFLSAIELLAYPANVIHEVSDSSESSGFFGIGSFFAKLFGPSSKKSLPYVSFLFGSQRVIPVRIKSIHVTEQAFDTTLQPIRATVKIVMGALTEQESKRHAPTRECTSIICVLRFCYRITKLVQFLKKDLTT